MNKFSKVLLVALVLVGTALATYAVVAQTATTPKPSFEVAANAGPALSGSGITITPQAVSQNKTITLSVQAYDVSGISSIAAVINDRNGKKIADLPLFDDGQHSDAKPNDSIFANTYNVGSRVDGVYPVNVTMTDRLNNITPLNGVISLVIGAGACTLDSDCSATQVCCSGLCGSNACAIDSQCNDSNASTTDTCNTTSCPNICTHTTITTCTNGDGYCPATCTRASDNDCADTTPPTVSITVPATDGTSVTTSTMTVTANAADPDTGISKVDFYLDSETVPRDTQQFDSPSGSHNYNWVFGLSGVPNGTHTLKTIASNGSSLTAQATRTISVSRTSAAPFNVSITSPANGSAFASSNTISVVVHAEDDLGLASVAVYSTNGGGPINTVTATGTNVNVTVPINAGSIALQIDPVRQYAYRESRPFLPFIPVADAAIVQQCTTTTSTSTKGIYAVVTDTESNATNSSPVSLSITYSSTTCVDVIVPDAATPTL